MTGVPSSDVPSSDVASDSTAASDDRVFRMPVALRWSDLDAFDHVNNARYLTFLEQALHPLARFAAGLLVEQFENLFEPLYLPLGLLEVLLEGGP